MDTIDKHPPISTSRTNWNVPWQAMSRRNSGSLYPEVAPPTGRRRIATIVTSNLFDLNGVEGLLRSRLRDASLSQVTAFAKYVQDYRPYNSRKPL